MPEAVNTEVKQPTPSGRLLPLVRLWCRIFGHVQSWSPDDADKYCRRCGHDFYPGEAEDPYQSEDYQRYVAECAKHCECSHIICDSVLAGAPCEMRIEDDDDDDDGYSPVEPYHDDDGCPTT